jgi:hypothetical protein
VFALLLYVIWFESDRLYNFRISYDTQGRAGVDLCNVRSKTRILAQFLVQICYLIPIFLGPKILKTALRIRTRTAVRPALHKSGVQICSILSLLLVVVFIIIHA